MRHRIQLPEEERRIRSRLAKIIHDQALIKGSLVNMARTCGKPGCKCRQGEKHVSLYLSTKVEGRPKMIFVPGELERQIHDLVQNYHQAAALVEELSAGQVKKFLAMKKGAKNQKKSGQS